MAKDRKYKVIISDRARLMLGAHMPNRYPFFEEPFIVPNKYHKMFVEKWYLVLYQIKDDTVYVDYILDCRRDYSWLIK